MEQCYNKGCGSKYDPIGNDSSSCTYHPGVPVFHDALKGWSCCKKRSTDFTEFLNIPGCTNGFHSNAKPAETPPSENERNSELLQSEMITVRAKEPKSNVPVEIRPSQNTPLKALTNNVTSSLKQALAHQLEHLSLKGNETDDGSIKVGTSCKNNTCKKVYTDQGSESEQCSYHPGGPVFHEGMKYWSCCQRKTSEFDTFLSQEGCASGRHVWFKAKTEEHNSTSCRYDWFQTPNTVTLSVYCKAADPDLTLIEVNAVYLKLHIIYEAGQSAFDMDVNLFGVINPNRSHVRMLGTKVEIILNKQDSFSWRMLEYTLPHDESV